MSTALSAIMSYEEAGRAVKRVRTHLEGAYQHLADARQAMLDLYERRGWQPLGYESWVELAQAEFHVTESRVYGLLAEARAERDVRPVAAALPDLPGSVLRPLSRLGCADDRRFVFEVAVREAGGLVPQAASVARLVDATLEQQAANKLPFGPAADDDAETVLTDEIAREAGELQKQQAAEDEWRGKLGRAADRIRLAIKDLHARAEAMAVVSRLNEAMSMVRHMLGEEG